jgi:hypothetical protein
MVQVKGSPSGSRIRILQTKPKGLFIEPFAGFGVPKTGT